MDADTGQTHAFSLLHDKNMLAPASAASWCPTMDLLALATSDGQLALSRLDWNKTGGERENRLWTANPDSPVTSLGWRPDGKILVSGHADGAVQLYHAEDGEVLHASRPHRGSPVTSLHWQDAPVEDSRRSACAYQSATSRFALPTTGGNFVHGAVKGLGSRKGDGGAAKGDGGERSFASSSQHHPRRGAGARALFDHFDPPTRLTVLCSGDASGVVVMSAFGIFPIASTRVGDGPNADFPLGDSNALEILHASASPDLSRVLVAFTANGGLDAVGASASVPLLAMRSKEMCTAASHGSQVTALVAEIECELANAADVWVKARVDFDKRVAAMRERVNDGGNDDPDKHFRDGSMDMDVADDDGMDTGANENADPNDGKKSRRAPTIEDHLLAHLATGRVDDRLEQFLSHEFRAKDIRKLARSMDAAATAVHAVLMERVAPAAESCALRLAELRALARWRERSQSIGLDEAAADAALTRAESCALAAFSAARVATATAAWLRAFFVLLLRTQRALAFESPDGGSGAGEDGAALPALNAKLAEEFLTCGVSRDTLGEELGALGEKHAGVVGTDGVIHEETAEGRVGASRTAFLAAVRGAAAAAGFGDPSAAAACDTTLWSACAELKGACAGLLDAPRDALSKSFVWDKAFSIVRSHPDSDSDKHKPRVSHGGWSPDGESETLCFHAGGAHVGMLRLMAGVPESALSLEAPQGHVVADAAAYTEGRCLALLQPVNDGDDSETQRPASVVMVDPSALVGASVDRTGFGGGEGGYALVDAGVLSAAPSAPPGCVPARGVLRVPARVKESPVAAGTRYRSLPGTIATPPLAVGRAKGLAAVLVGQKRIVLLDLEEDECDEDDE